MSNALAYSIKVWITSVILGSIISAIPIAYHSNGIKEMITALLGMSFFIIGIAAMLSLCSWLLLFVFTYMLTKQQFNLVKTKMALSVIGLLLSLAPLLWITDGDLSNNLIPPLEMITYPTLILIGIWVFKLSSASSEVNLVNL